MTSPKVFFDTLFELGVDFFTGVPDSLLKEFCSYVDAVLPPESHIISANEGTAVGIATGYQLATGHLPLVYLQNSGLGNTVNPLLSLADTEVYAVPMIVLVGWRGAPGEKDEPQHLKQGRVTEAMLDAMEIPYRILTADEDEALANARWATETAKQRSGPVILLARKGAFSKSEARRDTTSQTDLLTREEAIFAVTEALPADSTIVATTGMISRELYEQRQRTGNNGASDFLTVGSMGHASQIALGLSNALPGRRIVCLDGDGAILMHMGGLATAGVLGRGDFLHIVLNNGAHDSVGGQPTVAFDVSLTGVATACGYRHALGPVKTVEDIRSALAELRDKPGCRLLEIHVSCGSRPDLGRPKDTPLANKQKFVARLEQGHDG
ncbi:phosphonopyruvate decarboxylase [Sphingopyxis microcysteis]|uniref:phosphonopyruvate decarboxylase n=1 Tax=Sphingopyxis microcysteis TaxID=2484145 RepID=UPI0014479D71|nr:phosphonopyruvate decarboxylase [Sphingopyxis microcysteis]